MHDPLLTVDKSTQPLIILLMLASKYYFPIENKENTSSCWKCDHEE